MKRLIAGLLALLMLTISLKVGVAFHYCGGNLAKSVMLIGYGKASCGMEEKNKGGDTCPSRSIHHSHCCQNLISQIKTDNFQSPLITIKHCPEFTYLVVNFNDFISRKSVEIKDQKVYFPPPEITSVSRSFIKVFLI